VLLTTLTFWRRPTYSSQWADAPVVSFVRPHVTQQNSLIGALLDLTLDNFAWTRSSLLKVGQYDGHFMQFTHAFVHMQRASRNIYRKFRMLAAQNHETHFVCVALFPWVLKFTRSRYSSVGIGGVPRNFVRRGGGSTNSVEDRGQRERGSGGGSPLVRGSGGSCNLVQEISFHIVKFS